jgi:hypothetical protein
MDIKDAENKLDQADSFLTKLKVILKKHWGIILILALLGFGYWVFTSEDTVEEEPYQEEYYDESLPEEGGEEDYYYEGE